MKPCFTSNFFAGTNIQPREWLTLLFQNGCARNKLIGSKKLRSIGQFRGKNNHPDVSGLSQNDGDHELVLVWPGPEDL